MVVRNGYKQTEVGVIPEDWEIKSIEDLTPRNRKYTIVDGPFGSNLKTIHYRKSGIPIITSGYVTDGRFIAEKYLYVDLEKFKQEKRSAVNGGDIVMAKIGERCGASAILPMDHPQGILSGNSLKITIDEDRYSTKLIWQILWNCHSAGDFELLKTTGAQPAISMSNLKKFKIPVPKTKVEQTAIANALSDMDALIAQTEKLIEKKKAIKHGVMQELLKPKEGWVTKKLGEVCELRNGYSFQSQCYCEGGAYNIITISNVQDGILESSNFSKIAQMPIDIQSHQILKKGDILISLTGNVGRLCKVNIDNCLLNQRVGKLSPTTINHDFLYCILQNSDFRRVMIQSAVGGAQGNIGKDTVLNYTIEYPLSKTEQIDIASAFSDLTAEIGELSTKLQKLKLQKQGMMQALLTGKIRLI